MRKSVPRSKLETMLTRTSKRSARESGISSSLRNSIATHLRLRLVYVRSSFISARKTLKNIRKLRMLMTRKKKPRLK